MHLHHIFSISSWASCRDDRRSPSTSEWNHQTHPSCCAETRLGLEGLGAFFLVAFLALRFVDSAPISNGNWVVFFGTGVPDERNQMIHVAAGAVKMALSENMITPKISWLIMLNIGCSFIFPKKIEILKHPPCSDTHLAICRPRRVIP